MIDLRRGQPLDQTNALEVRPVQGTFDIPGAEILAPGDPYRSVLYYRMAKLGRGRMPHIGSEVVDERGLRLMHDWVRQLPIRKDERLLVERLKLVVEPSGAVGLAAALSGLLPKKARRVGIVLSGGNIEIARLTRLLSDEVRVP